VHIVPITIVHSISGILIGEKRRRRRKRRHVRVLVRMRLLLRDCAGVGTLSLKVRSFIFALFPEMVSSGLGTNVS